MIKSDKIHLWCCVFLLAGLGELLASVSVDAQTKPWVDGYYTGYSGYGLTASQIDYSAISHVIDFAVVVNSDGSFDYSNFGGTSQAQSFFTSSVTAAHKGGAKVLICFGGAGDGGWETAVSSNLSTLVANMVNVVKTYGFDGIDIDWESGSEPSNSILALAQALRTQLPSPQYLLTTYVVSNWNALGTSNGNCYQYFDQINANGYDLSGAFQGWVSWYNGSLFIYGNAANNGAEGSACLDKEVTALLNAGVPASKIGIGSEFGGAIWSGVTGPNQTPGGGVSYDVPYNQIVSYGGTYTWDSQAQAGSRLSSHGWATYDDSMDVAAKLAYIKSKGIGGMFIWSLDMDHKSGTVGQDPLLNAVKANWGVSGPRDTIPPVVAITSPTNGSTDSGRITISANAFDSSGIADVIFNVDGKQISLVAASPYSISWNSATVSNGSHTISAIALDAVGNSSTASITINTLNSVDTTKPALAITSPVNGSTDSNYVTISANASDKQGISQVTFDVDGNQIGVATLPPYSISWNSASVSNGSHTISVMAIDSIGNSSSVSIVITTLNSFTRVVAITSPANGAKISGDVTFSANASSPSGISRVRFYVNGSRITTVRTPPYVITWTSTSVVDGSYILKVTAVDSSGNSFSDSITVTVSNLSDVLSGGSSPTTYDLSQNYPNPFNPTTNIRYQLPVSSFVLLKVYDVLGREVKTLMRGQQSAGYYSITFDASDLPSGAYIYRLTTSSGFTQVKKMIFAK